MYVYCIKTSVLHYAVFPLYNNNKNKYSPKLREMFQTFQVVDEWKTNLMSLTILFHLLCAQHVSDINISIFRSLRLCWWITTSVVLFCKDGWFSVSVNLRCLVVCVCVWCDVLCHFVVVGSRIFIDTDRYLLCFVIIVFACVCPKHVEHIRSEIK